LFHVIFIHCWIQKNQDLQLDKCLKTETKLLIFVLSTNPVCLVSLMGSQSMFQHSSQQSSKDTEKNSCFPSCVKIITVDLHDHLPSCFKFSHANSQLLPKFLICGPICITLYDLLIYIFSQYAH
jgi:hypothetical protein